VCRGLFYLWSVWLLEGRTDHVNMSYLPVNDHTKVGSGVEEEHATTSEAQVPLPEHPMVAYRSTGVHHVL
jgi:hypothetical protein